MVTHCCTSLKVKKGDILVFGLSCLCSLNSLGLSAFIYFGQVTKRYDAFGPLFLCPSNVVTPVFDHECTPHLLLDTNSVYTIQFLLVGDWFVQQTPNKPQTQWERDVMQMWPNIFFESIVWCAKRQLQRRHLDPFLAAFYLIIWQILRNVFINSKDSIFRHPVCLL